MPRRSAREAREQLAAELLGASLDGVTIYASPPDTVISPALVVAPASPYRQQTALCADELRLRIVGTVPRAAAGRGLDALDELLEAARIAAIRVPGCAWESIDSVGLTIYAGGAEHLSGALNVSIQL